MKKPKVHLEDNYVDSIASSIFLRAVCLSVAAVVIMISGCQNNRPIFGPPGTMEAQRTRAMLHDPFPSDEVAPKIFGARPLGFERPRAEASQLKLTPNVRNGDVLPARWVLRTRQYQPKTQQASPGQRFENDVIATSSWRAGRSPNSSESTTFKTHASTRIALELQKNSAVIIVTTLKKNLPISGGVKSYCRYCDLRFSNRSFGEAPFNTGYT